MPLRLYNTLTRTKEEFRPLDSNNVRMYVCGPTVWDYAHIGNARPVIVFDLLFRLLRQLYGETRVTYVRNITDVDDKINAKAREEGVSIRDLTERTVQQFHADIAALGVLPPTVEPRATEHIAEMIAIIERLIAAGHAYAADGHVLFDVPSMKDYGQLSRRSLDEMMAGARVDVAPYKRGDMDFVLWKPSDAETPGWDSPWGRGRPGWHIECSAMSWKHLGEIFDIHGGGIDLVFPHHENEIAQTRCAFGHDVMANVWMHNGFLQVEGQKMSKSLGNFVTINELLKDWPGDVLRFNMLRTHYRQPIDWTFQSLQETRRILLSFQKHFVPDLDPTYGDEEPVEVLAALSDDLNTPAAIAALHEMVSAITKLERAWDPEQHRIRSRFSNALRFLGFERLDKFHHRGMGNLDEADKTKIEEIEALITARLDARKAKNWAESDRIRDELASMGIAIKDNKDGTTGWEVKR
ncbi:MAG: cysteine--tRNA ligase [Aestuariivirga sp.]|uniref:cysteine--tRNA ligase n=1 Tax=Aestuariivirga sp. TaxID=2650926 RepID=UPI0025BC1D50|nr:cysteine--tRNA ligase [Aestuariivirga sp.]MCA3559709.1 cysteine--tRNA ligase [Aestuariivirga sp.]